MCVNIRRRRTVQLHDSKAHRKFTQTSKCIFAGCLQATNAENRDILKELFAEQVANFMAQDRAAAAERCKMPASIYIMWLRLARNN